MSTTDPPPSEETKTTSTTYYAAAADVVAEVRHEDMVVCVGDIHGHLNKLKALWENLKAELSVEGLRKARVVFLGDYCDRGPDTKGVLQFLIDLQNSRRPVEKGVCGETIFLAGNHDFAFSSFLGCMPATEQSLAIQCDLHTEAVAKARQEGEEYSTVYDEEVSGGMHWIGRRWAYGCIQKYESDLTCDSYGVTQFPAALLEKVANHTWVNDMKDFFAELREAAPVARAAMLEVVPPSHLDFLREMRLVYDGETSWAPGRIVCLHAGLLHNRPAEAQINALVRRDLGGGATEEFPHGVLLKTPGEVVLPLHARGRKSSTGEETGNGVTAKKNPCKIERQSSDTPGGLPSERPERPIGNPFRIADVSAHPELRDVAVEVNGHHGVLGSDSWEDDGRKYVVDRCGGREGRPLVALVLPQRLLVSTSDPLPSDEISMEPADDGC